MARVARRTQRCPPGNEAVVAGLMEFWGQVSCFRRVETPKRIYPVTPVSPWGPPGHVPFGKAVNSLLGAGGTEQRRAAHAGTLVPMREMRPWTQMASCELGTPSSSMAGPVVAQTAIRRKKKRGKNGWRITRTSGSSRKRPS